MISYTCLFIWLRYYRGKIVERIYLASLDTSVVDRTNSLILRSL